MDRTNVMPAGLFKQGCLAVLDNVAATHREVVITKRGKPVAKLVPITSSREHEATVLSRLRGRGRMLVSEADFLKPTSDEAGWNL